MFSRIRKRITYTNVAMTLALVFAMSGGAYAASKYLITSTKQISPKVLKALKGKTGTPGAAGLQGLKGETGAAGAVGAIGAVGPIGPKGDTGGIGPKGDTGGIGATGPAGPKGATGATGPAGTDGTNGAPGATGATGPAGPQEITTLPPGSSEKGAWGAAGMPAPLEGIESSVLYAPISFTIPLKTAPTAHVITGGETTECPGGVTKPKAEPGNLCIFIESTINVKLALATDPGTGEFGAAGTTGSIVYIIAETAGKGVLVKGTWAVTGG
jgi:Collagen triple helix repeat (20 copies)